MDEIVNRGTCRSGQCECPLPWTGHNCEKRLECLWWSESENDWKTGGCELDRIFTTEWEYVCDCSLVGSADVQVVLRQLLVDPFSMVINLVDLTNLNLDDLATNWVPLTVLCVVNFIYLIAMVRARRMNNEEELRKYEKHYSFWRAQHKLRTLPKKPNFRQRTWTQLKGQHKLLRVFYMKFEVGQDPVALHTGAQKATVLYCLVLTKLAVSALLSQSGGGVKQMDEGQKFLFRLQIGMIAAAVALPVTVFLDQLFWKAQRLKNKHQKFEEESTEVQVIARAAMHCALDMMDTRTSLLIWMMAVEDLKIVEMQAKLLTIRMGRAALYATKAVDEKAVRELEMTAKAFDERHCIEGETKFAQFGSLLATIAHSAGDDAASLTKLMVAEATRRMQRAFRRRQALKARLLEQQSGSRVVRAWRNFQTNRKVDRVILADVTRLQVLYRLHARARRERAAQVATELASARPRVAPPKW
jgi:hypothetical protein